MGQIHSVPIRPQPDACLSAPGAADTRLRSYVVGYAGFRSGSGAPVDHRLLPLSLTTLVIPFDGTTPLVTGPRATATLEGPTTWGYGVTVGLTPAGASALLGVPMPALAGQTVALTDVAGRRASAVAPRLASASGWPARFAVLDEVLTGWLGGAPVDPVVDAAWRRLQSPDRPPIDALAAEFAVSRRYLELGFRRQVGLSPGTVARVARFQRAVTLLSTGAGLTRTATESGYADQPHFTRETRAMAGVTPAELCAFVQYRPLVAP